MDTREWLRSRKPSPPAALLTRMESALAEPQALSLTEDLLRAGARILDGLTTSDGGIERSTAIDLLAADALVTYAVEAAAAECESFAARSGAIMTTVANVPIS